MVVETIPRVNREIGKTHATLQEVFISLSWGFTVEGDTSLYFLKDHITSMALKIMRLYRRINIELLAYRF